jgi:TolB protein
MNKKYLNNFLVLALALFLFGCGKSQETQWSPSTRSPSAGAGEKRTAAAGGETARTKREAVRLTEELFYDSSPCWSPDGSKIAYSRYDNNGQNIMLLDIDYTNGIISASGEPKYITKENFINKNPAWAGEEGSIIFTSDRTGKNTIFIASIETGELTDLGLEGTQARLSPEGDKIAYVYKNNIAISKLNEEDSQEFITTAGFNEFPSWSPDGEKLVFSSNYDIVQTYSERPSLRNLTNEGWNSYPSWSEAGDKIVFSSNAGGQYDLWLMNPDGSGKVRITDTPQIERFPNFSPDGRFVAFQADYEGSFDIWVIEID